MAVTATQPLSDRPAARARRIPGGRECHPHLGLYINVVATQRTNLDLTESSVPGGDEMVPRPRVTGRAEGSAKKILDASSYMGCFIGIDGRTENRPGLKEPREGDGAE